MKLKNKVWFFTILLLLIILMWPIYRETSKRCKREVFWDLAVKLICQEEGYSLKPCYLMFVFSSQKEFCPVLNQNELPLYYIHKYIENGGSRKRPFFHITYGYALLLNGQKEKGINEFLQASDDELDLNYNALKEFGKNRLANMSIYNKVPRWEIIWYYEKIGKCEMALKHIEKGLQNSQVEFVKMTYNKLKKEHNKKCKERMNGSNVDKE